MKYLPGKKYKLTTLIEHHDGTIFEPGEKFTYRSRNFISDYDQQVISAASAHKIELETKQPIFQEIKL